MTQKEESLEAFKSKVNMGRWEIVLTWLRGTRKDAYLLGLVTIRDSEKAHMITFSECTSGAWLMLAPKHLRQLLRKALRRIHAPHFALLRPLVGEPNVLPGTWALWQGNIDGTNIPEALVGWKPVDMLTDES